MKALRSLLIASLLALAYNASAQESQYKFEFHGFVTGSLYMQDQVFNASGQGLLFFAPTPANNAPCKTDTCTGANGGTPTFAAGQATKSGTYLGGDMRQSRYAFSLAGPATLGGATPKAYFEGDLFGGGGGAPLVESWIWRIRQAYAELKWTQFVLQAGQFSAQLAFAQMPDSVSHIANPISFGAGNYGWRTLGVRGIYTVPLNGVTLEVAGEVVQSSWANNQIPSGTYTSIGSGMASGLPQLELRVKASGKAGDLGWMLYGDALYEQADLKGFGQPAQGATQTNVGVTLADGSVKTSVSPSAFELGGKFTFAPVFLAFNAYTGNGLGSMAGALLQMGDINEIGYWANLGVNATKEFSLSGTYGYSKPKENDVRNWAAVYANANMKTENTLMAGQAKYLENGFALALEYIRYETKYVQGTWAQYQAGTNAASIKTNGYQLIASAAYYF